MEAILIGRMRSVIDPQFDEEYCETIPAEPPESSHIQLESEDEYGRVFLHHILVKENYRKYMIDFEHLHSCLVMVPVKLVISRDGSVLKSVLSGPISKFEPSFSVRVERLGIAYPFEYSDREVRLAG